MRLNVPNCELDCVIGLHHATHFIGCGHRQCTGHPLYYASVSTSSRKYQAFLSTLRCQKWQNQPPQNFYGAMSPLSLEGQVGLVPPPAAFSRDWAALLPFTSTRTMTLPIDWIQSSRTTTAGELCQDSAQYKQIWVTTIVYVRLCIVSCRYHTPCRHEASLIALKLVCTRLS